MKIINLKDEQKVFFAGMDPFEILDKKQALPGFTLGAAIENEGKSDTPVGLMICYFRDDIIIIRWFYVAPEYRGKGYGEELLSAALEVAKQGGYKYISAYLPAEYGRNYICPDAEEYFKAHAFDNMMMLANNGGKLISCDVFDEDDEYHEVEPYDIFEKLLKKLEEEERLENLGLLNKVEMDDSKDEELAEVESITLAVTDVASCKSLKSGAGAPNVKGINELTIPKLGRGIKRCLKKHKYGGDEDLEKLTPEWYDMELSSCALEDDEVCGLFLLHKDDEGVYWTEYLYDVSKNSKINLINMLKRSAAIFVEKCPPNAKLNVNIYSAETKALIMKLFPKK
ncbi:MAG: GNAT family N-acetyltransferase [Lachnospiraceae bacterium]|nr:GNAT family N-acetyltransferase [Lachnospiraceae bacterium]